jgi:hypothetical protein
MSSANSVTHSAPATGGDWRELASRENNGLAIALLWSKAADQVKVTVVDGRLQEEFEFDVERAEALPAFYHTFAYVACRRLSVGVALREPRDLQPQS